MKASDSKTFTKVESHIRSMTDAYLELGVAIVEDGWRKAYYSSTDKDECWAAVRKYRREKLAVTSHTFVRAYLRAVANELKRPFVVAEITPRSITMNIPRRRYTEPLFASFLLAPGVSGNSRSKLDSFPVWYSDSSTLVRVTFNGDKGKKIFDAFIERCRTEDEYKKALRLI